MKSSAAWRYLRQARTPWWLCVLLAALLYVALTYILPACHPTNPALQRFVEAGPSFAPIVTIPLLLLGAIRLYDSDEKKEIDPPSSNKPEIED